MRPVLLAVALSILSTGPSIAASLVYECRFETTCSAHTCTQSDPARDMVYRLDDDGSAWSVNPIRDHAVTASAGKGVVSFVQDVAGRIRATTVLSNGRAVHSSHSVFREDIVAIQSFGSCQKTEAL
ncbi:hypothetical protein [Jannaschia sp. 2305UL9-9]|uniref:hypothetical protein n=1 Tax=Jannaschia sp. 2305UL9-9 TaxID=3121638 RepID=UPI00352963A5